MNREQEIRKIIARKDDNGGPFWSRTDGDIHAPHGYSTIDTLGVLGELGLEAQKHALISEAVEFLFEYQSPEGAFKYSPKSSKLPCMTARILAALGRLGFAEGERAELSYRHLLEIQWQDGGWRCATVKLGKSPATDASNPGTTLYVLDAFRFRENEKETMAKLGKGAEFLLGHWESRKPLGPCEFGLGSRFFKIEYPFLRYNLFYYVYVLSFYPEIHDHAGFRAAYAALEEKCVEGGIFPENPHKAWREFEFAKKEKLSLLATERWKEVQQNLNQRK